MEPGDAAGNGPVDATSQPDKGARSSGRFREEALGLNPDRAAAGGDDDLADRARSRARQARERVESTAGRGADRARDLFHEAEDRFDGGAGPLRAARDNPLAAVGIAFALGFLLAGDSDEEASRHPALSKARNQIKGAIMGGISAAISQQLRSFIEEQGGIGALLAGLGVPVPGGRDQPYFVPDDELRDA